LLSRDQIDQPLLNPVVAQDIGDPRPVLTPQRIVAANRAYATVNEPATRLGLSRPPVGRRPRPLVLVGDWAGGWASAASGSYVDLEAAHTPEIKPVMPVTMNDPQEDAIAGRTAHDCTWSLVVDHERGNEIGSATFVADRDCHGHLMREDTVEQPTDRGAIELEFSSVHCYSPVGPKRSVRMRAGP
jgi:hypothetical protein